MSGPNWGETRRVYQWSLASIWYRSLGKAPSFSFVFVFSFCVFHCVISLITSYCKDCNFTNLFPRALILLLSIISLVTWVKASPWQPSLGSPINLNNTLHPSIVPSMAASATINPSRCASRAFGDVGVTACGSPCPPVPVRGHACLNRPTRPPRETDVHTCTHRWESIRLHVKQT